LTRCHPFGEISHARQFIESHALPHIPQPGAHSIQQRAKDAWLSLRKLAVNRPVELAVLAVNLWQVNQYRSHGGVMPQPPLSRPFPHGGEQSFHRLPSFQRKPVTRLEKSAESWQRVTI